MRAALMAVAILCLGLSGAAAATAENTMNLCRNAAIKAADRHGVPREVMLAITLVETRTKRGGHSGPWPWTVNVAGKGAWFDTRAAALLHAQSARERGQNSFDVGCFQLNYRWHGEHFASIDEMFEPGPSGDYAARFVRDLYAESGNWMTAAGHYHSRTPVHSKRYRGLVQRTVRRLEGEPVVVAAAEDTTVRPRIERLATGNGWPLSNINIRRPGNGASAGSVELRIFRPGQPLRVVNGATR